MSNVTPEQLEDAILLVTGSPEWQTITVGLFNEIKAAQANVFNLPTWDDVNEEKGFIRGLLYVITLRDQLVAAKTQAEADANV